MTTKRIAASIGGQDKAAGNMVLPIVGLDIVTVSSGNSIVLQFPA